MKDTWKRWCWDNSVKFIDKDRPKKRTKKVIGELYAGGEPVDDEEFSVLTEVERLIRQGVEVFTEIPYKSSVIEFYYFPQEDCDE